MQPEQNEQRKKMKNAYVSDHKIGGIPKMNRHRIFGWIASALLGLCFSARADAAEKMTPEEKIKIIEEIVEAKVSENWNKTKPWKGLTARKDVLLLEILAAVQDIMPLKADKPVELPPDVVRGLEEKARKKYPASDSELKAKYAAEADKKFPVYRAGETVTVYYRVFGGTFDRFTGKFYRQDPKFVWIGNRKISKADLKGGYAPRFDPVQADRSKQLFVDQGIEKYHKERTAFEKSLREDAMGECRGKVKYKGQWLTVGSAVKKIFRDTIGYWTEKTKCPKCGNRKFIDIVNYYSTAQTCSSCGGSGSCTQYSHSVSIRGGSVVDDGSSYEARCSSCGGTGRSFRKWSEKKRVPCPVCSD